MHIWPSETRALIFKVFYSGRRSRTFHIQAPVRTFIRSIEFGDGPCGIKRFGFAGSTASKEANVL